MKNSFEKFSSESILNNSNVSELLQHLKETQKQLKRIKQELSNKSKMYNKSILKLAMEQSNDKLKLKRTNADIVKIKKQLENCEIHLKQHERAKRTGRKQ